MICYQITCGVGPLLNMNEQMQLNLERWPIEKQNNIEVVRQKNNTKHRT